MREASQRFNALVERYLSEDPAVSEANLLAAIDLKHQLH